MYSKRNKDNIPIKIGGWDGKFVYEKQRLKDGYEVVKPSRGTLERQQWQEGKKKVIINSHENQKSTTHSEQTTKTLSESKEHTIHVETEAQNFNNGQQHQDLYNNVHLENQNSNIQYAYENQNHNRYNDQQQYHQDQQQLHQNQQHEEKHDEHQSSNQMQQKTSDAANLHGYHTDTETLPPQWNGRFPEGYRNYRPKPEQNRSNVKNMYGFSTDPIIHPTQWDGKFVKNGETFLVSDRNQSATNNFYDYDNTPTVLPTTWNGEFKLDPNDVRIKANRNASDVRDYADHRRFVTRE